MSSVAPMGDRRDQPVAPTRRHVLKVAGGLLAGCAAPAIDAVPALATPADMRAALNRVIGSAPLNTGKVKLEIPPLVENGNTVPCSITVESSMTPTDYVRAIHVLTEKNPQPNVISVRLGPHAGRASISTRIRLSDTQTVLAIAEFSDGTFWSERVHVIITLGACLEDII